MNHDVLKVVKIIAARFQDAPRNQCSIACSQLADFLADDVKLIDRSALRVIRLAGPRHRERADPALAPEHLVLEIGVEVADPTWRQIDAASAEPWKVYSTASAINEDWTSAKL